MGLLVFILTVTGAVASAQGSDSVALLRDCSHPDEIVGQIAKADHIKVRYGLAGDRDTCYTVQASVNGVPTAGYLLGAEHPDVAAFERDSRSRIPEIPLPPPPPAPASSPVAGSESKEKNPTKPAVELPTSFAGLRGISPRGRPVSLSQIGAPLVVLYFWSANDKRSIREAEAMDGVYELYRNKGVGLVGVVTGTSAAQVSRVMNDQEIVWPQMLDHGEIAARYPATKETGYYILDRNRNVVAAMKSSADVQRELLKLRRAGGGTAGGGSQ